MQVLLLSGMFLLVGRNTVESILISGEVQFANQHLGTTRAFIGTVPKMEQTLCFLLCAEVVERRDEIGVRFAGAVKNVVKIHVFCFPIGSPGCFFKNVVAPDVVPAGDAAMRQVLVDGAALLVLRLLLVVELVRVLHGLLDFEGGVRLSMFFPLLGAAAVLMLLRGGSRHR